MERRIKVMENPLLAFRNAKGWSRVEFLRRSGLSYQTLRTIEIGETKHLTDRTKECLAFVGIDVDGIQEQLDLWHEYQQEKRRNGMFSDLKG
jgi:transcriptional regulator with XRE-family HTH domain